MAKHGQVNESTIARMAGNIAAGMVTEKTALSGNLDREFLVMTAVEMAREIAAEVERTAPKESEVE